MPLTSVPFEEIILQIWKAVIYACLGAMRKKQGRIHGYPSRVWVGRGSNGKSHLGVSGELEKLKNAEKVTDRLPNRPTNRRTKRSIEWRSMRLKTF